MNLLRKKRQPLDWLTSNASDELDEFWQERVVNILGDLSVLPHLRYAYAVGLKGGRLTEIIGPGGEIVTDLRSDPAVYFHLAQIVENYLTLIDQPAAAHVTVELADEMLFVGSTGALILVASFDGNAARGFVGMKLAKRISHLRSIFKSTTPKRGR